MKNYLPINLRIGGEMRHGGARENLRVIRDLKGKLSALGKFVDIAASQI